MTANRETSRRVGVTRERYPAWALVHGGSTLRALDLSVRIAHPTDARALARVHSTSWRWAYRDLLPASYLAQLEPAIIEKRWARKLSSLHREDTVYVAEVGRELAGFVVYGQHDDRWWRGHAGEVFMLYVDPDLLGHGIGRALLSHAFDDLERLGCYWAVVWVLERNDRGRAFYERAGLRLDGARRCDPFIDRGVPVVRYARALNRVFDPRTLSLGG
jgi:ribosomal protein S18 acetylase RimI-like enzyme